VAVTFHVARETVIRKIAAADCRRRFETVELRAAAGRVLGEDIDADRDTPALSRSARDGYAIRAGDVPGELAVIGEVRAGERYAGEVARGQAVEIMTGAPVPVGADAVVMVEHCERIDGRVRIDAAAEPLQNINPQGCDAATGEIVLRVGKRLDYSDVALLAMYGRSCVQVYQLPDVAIVATGDEIVDVAKKPAEHQIRNSNAYALAAQVARAGGIPRILPVARDTVEHTRKLVERGMQSDLLLLSGGVSAGKYDVVEPVLAAMGAEFFFDSVLIQPGKPLVFGQFTGAAAQGAPWNGKFFFGLPGNPASTMVTFEIFARAAVELLGGQTEPMLPMPFARLTRDFRHRPGLTRFLPAHVSADGGEVTPVESHGSGDVPALTRANAYLVADPLRAEYARGDFIPVLLK